MDNIMDLNKIKETYENCKELERAGLMKHCKKNGEVCWYLTKKGIKFVKEFKERLAKELSAKSESIKEGRK